MALGIIVSAAFLQPGISFALVRPFFSIWRRLKLFRTSIAAKFTSSRTGRFWEIDMTKFEP